MLRVPDSRAYLHKLFDRFLNLVIEEAPVGDDDDRIENFLVVAL